MKHFSGIFITKGQIRRVTIEALNEAEATVFGLAWGVGIEGEAPAPMSADRPPAALPEAYDMTETRRLLGGVSRGTIYKWAALGRLERVAGSRKVLITRRSIAEVGQNSHVPST